jgi:hypothetical protein
MRRLPVLFSCSLPCHKCHQCGSIQAFIGAPIFFALLGVIAIPFSELDVRSFMARQRWSEGSIFLVPQSDGRSSAGQALRRTPQALNSVVCAFYDVRPPGGALTTADLDADRLIAILFVTPELLNRGNWRVIGEAPVRHLKLMPRLREVEANGFVGAKIIGSGNIEAFLDAFYGLRAWDDWAKPDYLDGLLLSPEKKPKSLLFRGRK